MPEAEIAKSVYVNQQGTGQAKFSVPLHYPQHSIDAGIQPGRAAAVGHSSLRPGLYHPAQCSTADCVIFFAVFLAAAPSYPEFVG